jgi:hypothetical protein
MSSVIICLRNARRVGSTPLELYLEEAGHEVERTPGGWKHGPAPSLSLRHGGNLPSDARPIILSKHPLAWLRSRTRWALPTPRFSRLNQAIQHIAELAKKAACSINENAAKLLYSPMIDAYSRGYAGWFDALPRWLHVRHIDLLRQPQTEWDRICQYLGVPTTQLTLSDEQINPNGNNGTKGTTGQPFDPNFYLQTRWQSWFTPAERSYIDDYINSRNLHTLINGMGYYVDTSHHTLFTEPDPMYQSRSQPPE